MPSTEVFVGGMKVKSYRDIKPMAVASSVEATYDNAYYYIRIDSRIPQIVGTYTSNAYFPKSRNGASVYADKNNGSIKRNFPYKTLGSRGVSQYVYDPTGVATKEALVEEPTLDDLLAANQGTLANDLQNVDRSQVKIIWYVVKNQPGDSHARLNGQGAWHVDGVLTTIDTKSVTDIPGFNIGEGEYLESSTPKDPTPPAETTPPGEVAPPEVTTPPVTPETVEGYVKVDLHQQKHSDWEAIKTTIHIGSIVDRVNVTIPILREDIAEKDDFAIRTYDAYYEIKTDEKSFQQVVMSEYKNDPTAYVVELNGTPTPLTTEQKAAVATAEGEVFALFKGMIAQRLFYVKDTHSTNMTRHKLVGNLAVCTI